MIPKIIHYCWFGNTKPPKLMRQCLKSWQKYNPDYIIKEWNEINSPINDFLFAKQAFEKEKWAFVSDVIRLYAIYSEGGIYLDTDVELFKCLDDLRDAHCFIGYERDSNILQTAIFGAEKENPLIKEWLDFYNHKEFSDNKHIMSTLVNNRIQSQLLQDKGYQLDGKLFINKSLTIYPSDFFCPMSYVDHSINKTSNTYCIHYYSFSWSKHETFKGHIKDLLVRFLGEKIFRIIINILRNKQI